MANKHLVAQLDGTYEQNLTMKNGVAHLLALLVASIAFAPINGHGSDARIASSSYLMGVSKTVYEGGSANEEYALTVSGRHENKEQEPWHVVEEKLAGELSMYSPAWVGEQDFRALDIDKVVGIVNVTYGMLLVCGETVIETKSRDHRCVDYVTRAHLAVNEKVGQMNILRWAKLVEKSKYAESNKSFLSLVLLTNEKPASERRRAQEENRRITADIQTHLNKLGYDAGMVDGYKGTRTLAAINQFKADNEFSEYKTYTDSQLLIDLKKNSERRELQRGMLNEYVLHIQEKVQRNWIRPSSTALELSCAVEVRLSAKGEVSDAQIVQSSGVSDFDDSVEEAVHRASPLPMPPDPEVSKRFRWLRFEFKPDGV